MTTQSLKNTTDKTKTYLIIANIKVREDDTKYNALAKMTLKVCIQSNC
jgi:hypothetical protein